MMQTRTLVSYGLVFGLMVFASATALAQLPTCAQLDTNPAYGLAGNPVVIAHSTTLITSGIVPYCQVDFVVSERGGRPFGYADGEIQRVGLRVGLPSNTVDGFHHRHNRTVFRTFGNYEI